MGEDEQRRRAAMLGSGTSRRAVVAAALALSAACSDDAVEAEAPPQAAAQAQAPLVTTTVVTTRDAPAETTLPGRVVASREAEVRPQVSGIVTERLFEEGEVVDEGAPLYQIDPASYRTAFESAAASLARAQAEVVAARGRQERFAGLVERGAVSRQDYDDAVAAAEAAKADVALAEAARDEAKIDLDRTTIRAPIAGHLGRSRVTEGALVSAGQAEPLATVTALDPVYVDLTVSTGDHLRWKRRVATTDPSRRHVDVSLRLEDGTRYDREGRIALSEVNVAPDSGGVTLRAVFPNPDEVLLPGMFVRVVIEVTEEDGVVLVPQAAVSRTPEGEAQVVTVAPDGTTGALTVTTERAVGGDWAVSGLEPGTTIVTSGFQRFQPGQKVAPQDAGTPASGAEAPPPSASLR